MRLAWLAVLAFALVIGAEACEHDDYRCWEHKGDWHMCHKKHEYECPKWCHPKSGHWPCEMPKACHKLPDYFCVDSRHFCQAGLRRPCAPGTWCKTTWTDKISPCNQTKPPKCSHHMRCVGSKAFCHKGQVHQCPHGHVCVGWGPCVRPCNK